VAASTGGGGRNQARLRMAVAPCARRSTPATDGGSVWAATAVSGTAAAVAVALCPRAGHIRSLPAGWRDKEVLPSGDAARCPTVPSSQSRRWRAPRSRCPCQRRPAMAAHPRARDCVAPRRHRRRSGGTAAHTRAAAAAAAAATAAAVVATGALPRAAHDRGDGHGGTPGHDDAAGAATPSTPAVGGRACLGCAQGRPRRLPAAPPQTRSRGVCMPSPNASP